MPKASTQSIQALLAPHGLKLTLINGILGIRESTDFGLPPKMTTLVFVLGIKPDGSVGRGPPEGYNLQTAMGLSNEHYKVLMDAAWFILQHTNKIDTKKSIKQQEDGAIDLCIRKLLKVHPELQTFKPFGFWALRATFQLLLRNKSGQANSFANRMEKLAALIASGEEPPQPQLRKSRGRPRKNPAPASEGTTTTTNESTVVTQPLLEPGPLAAALCDDTGEVFDLNIGDSGLDDMDISIRQTIHDMSGIQLNADNLDDDEDDDDNGQFNMGKVHTATALKIVPVPTASAVALAPPVSTPPTPTASVAPPVLTVSLASAAPAAPAPSNVSAPAALTASVAPPVPTASPASAAPVAPSAPPASAPPAAAPPASAPPASAPPASAPPASAPPVNTASATPPVPALPPAHSPDSSLASIIWRGLTITPKVMANLKKAAARQAAGKQGRFAKIYEDLIGKLIENPDYDPSSEPDPVPQVAAKKAAPKAKAKAAPMPEPGLEANSNAGKGKGKAIVEFTDAPGPVNVRRSGRESKQTKR